MHTLLLQGHLTWWDFRRCGLLGLRRQRCLVIQKRLELQTVAVLLILRLPRAHIVIMTHEGKRGFFRHSLVLIDDILAFRARLQASVRALQDVRRSERLLVLEAPSAYRILILLDIAAIAAMALHETLTNSALLPD